MKIDLECPHCKKIDTYTMYNKDTIYACTCEKYFEVKLDIKVKSVTPYLKKLANPSKFMSQFD